MRVTLSAVLYLAAGVLLLVAALLRWWAAPAFEVLPDHYSAERIYAAELRSRETPDGAEVVTQSDARVRDHTLFHGPDHSIVQGDAHWMTRSGDLIFETVGTYGVDRRTRQNVAGYGDKERIGQYLFPPHTEPGRYLFWNPLYGGPFVATFQRAEVFHGLKVYVFDTRAEGSDETEGYSALPDVPEKFRVLTDGRGRVWVEPETGVVVDHEDSGTSHFVDAATGRRVGEPANRWQQRFKPETIEAQLRLATSTR